MQPTRGNRRDIYERPENLPRYREARPPNRNRRPTGPQRRRPRRRRGLSRKTLAVLLLLATAIIIVIMVFSGNPEPYNGYITARPDQEAQEYPHDYNPYPGYTPSTIIPLTSVPLSGISDTGYLALINRQHAIQNKPSSYQLYGAFPTVAVSRIDGMYLHPSALRAVAEMFSAARQEDIAAFFVSSGFRSYDAQAYIYGDGSNSDFVQPPGHSEHHTGLAADILAPGIGMMQMAESPEGEWLAANSYRYGLILRYPEHATHITGIAFEPWHFRYVGRAHAYYMKRNNLVLEEYIAKIHTSGYIIFEKAGQTHYVMHKTPQDGMIYVPYDLEFLISADNKGGFIIIAW